MPAGRPPSFQFYPHDFLSSRSVALMSPEERGGYIMLLCHAWDSDPCGTLPLDDQALGRLSGLGERWECCRTAILRAFAERSDGNGGTLLVQDRMVQERQAQLNRYNQARNGAMKTNEKRWSYVAQRSDSESLSGRPSVTPSSSSSSSSSSEPQQTCLPDGRRPRSARAPVKEPDRFKDFYERAYPRRDARRAAAKAFASALVRHPTFTAENLVEGAEEYAKQVEKQGIELRFVPMPATWLNQDRFLEFFEEE